MISSEVQRTLVKSPPELWAELSDPDALARHLGDLGEIRITRVEPEEKVEWEAPGATGTILIKASGWGTRVTLSISKELAPAEDAESEPASEDPSPDLGAEIPDAGAAGQDSVAVGEEQDAAADGEPVHEPAAQQSTADAALEPAPAEPAAAEASPELTAEPAGEPSPREERPPAAAPPRAPQRRGFLARFMFFLRGPEHAPEDEPPALAPASEPAAQPAAAESPDTAGAPDAAIGVPQANAETAPGPEAEDEPDDPDVPQAEDDQVLEQPQDAAHEGAGAAAQDLAEELRAAEESAAEHVTAILTSVLDRLGAAHHRPFSRA